MYQFQFSQILGLCMKDATQIANFGSTVGQRKAVAKGTFSGPSHFTMC